MTAKSKFSMAGGLALAIFASVISSGCLTATKNVNISTCKSWEGRYGSSAEISVNGEKIAIPKDLQVWILTDKTLVNLMKNMTDANYSNISVTNEKQ
jgi:hypothetical protein